MLCGVVIAGLAVGAVVSVMAEGAATTAAGDNQDTSAKCSTDAKVAADVKHDQKVARRKAEKAFNKQQAAEKRKFFEKQKTENQSFRKKQEAEKKRFLEMQATERKAFHEELAAGGAVKDVPVQSDAGADKAAGSSKTE